MGIGIGCGVGWGPGFGPEVIGYVGAGCGAGFSVGITLAGIGIGLPQNGLTRITYNADLPSQALNHHSSGRAPTLHARDRGRASAHGPEPASACSANSEAKRIY
ncbi:hypothetical protein BHM03_00055843 [Ensete ventricosum]|nr:hypothetical protein BHM03_00055843 [Ensete ventricosum]